MSIGFRNSVGHFVAFAFAFAFAITTATHRLSE
jgi:hypothetical protein